MKPKTKAALGAAGILILAFGILGGLITAWQVDYANRPPTAATPDRTTPPVRDVERIHLGTQAKDLLTFCDHGNRIYLSTYTSQVMQVIPQDPACVIPTEDGSSYGSHPRPTP